MPRTRGWQGRRWQRRWASLAPSKVHVHHLRVGHRFEGHVPAQILRELPGLLGRFPWPCKTSDFVLPDSTTLPTQYRTLAHQYASHSPADGATAVRFEELSFDKALSQYADEWRRLVNDGDLNVSMSPEFVHASARSVRRLEQMRVLAATSGGRLIGVVPFYIDRVHMHGVPLLMLSLGSNLIAYHHEIVAPGFEAEMLLALLADPARPWHVFRAESLTRGGPTQRALDTVASRVGSESVRYAADASPYLPITQTWTQYLAGRSANFRYNLKRKEKALQKAGAVEERWLERPEDAEEVLRCMRHVESKSWKSDLDVAVTSKPSEMTYYDELVPFLAHRGLLFANVIYLDGAPVAYHLCYRFRGRVGNLKTSFDNSHGSASPGAVVIQNAIRRSFDIGVREFDFLGDDQHHKRLWTENVRPHDSTFLFSRHWRARIIGTLKQLRQRWKPTEFHHILTRAAVRADHSN